MRLKNFSGDRDICSRVVMGMKRARKGPENGDAKKLSAPPGFVSLTSFKLKKVENNEPTNNSMVSGSMAKGKPNQMDTIYDTIDAAASKGSFWHRPWMLDNQNDHNLEESDSEEVSMDFPSRLYLPKGVAHGCPECSNCLKVLARWHPEDSRKVVLEEACVFHPTEEEFKDPLNYIASIYRRVDAYGICRIIPPDSWKPPCLIKEQNIWEMATLVTQTQRIDGLENQNIQGKLISVSDNGSCKRKSSFKMDLEHGVGSGCTDDPYSIGRSNVEGSEPATGPQFTFETFKEYDDNFKSQYFSVRSKVNGSDVNPTAHEERHEPSLCDIEGEYRRIVENPTEEIEVLCGEDLDTRGFGSGFPTNCSFSKICDYHEYSKSGWNLNNTPRLPGSLLSFESHRDSGLLVPRLNIGMCFSSFGWKVENHWLYLLGYLHLGAPKIWYSIPRRYNTQFEAIMKKHLHLLAEQPKLQDQLSSKLSLSTLKSAGMPVYKCIQYPGEFVLVLPGTYYSGFDSGFNCAESVNIAPIDWLPHGQNAIESYWGQGKKTSFSHDKVLFNAASEAVKACWEISLLRKDTPENLKWKAACGKDGTLAKALNSRIKLEYNRREYLCNSLQSQKMDNDFDATSKRECCICFYDLYLSAAQCPCSAERYSCLMHSKQLCSCAWIEKIFLFRYEMSELNILLEAVEGKLSSIYKWAKEVLKLSLYCSISEDGKQPSAHTSTPDSNGKESGEGERQSQRTATQGDTASRIREEMKARLHAKSSNVQKPKQNTTTSTQLVASVAADYSILLSSSESSSSSSSESEL